VDTLPKEDKFDPDHEGVAAVKNQLIESYQQGVIEDKENLSNNRGIYHFNNQKK